MRLHAIVIALAMVPLGLFAIGSYGKPQKPAMPVEQATVMRAVKTDSFRAPASVVAATPVTPVVFEHPVVREETRSIPAPGPPPPQSVKKKTRLAYRPDDICGRHHLKRVEIVRGKWRGWRCQR
jgi:hypothetical protein